MTQQQQIELLSSIMPEINTTHDPKGVMLKCAKKHNLSPAQLEKLGHVYNTAKTLVGLEKQAHRGDSFSIVDVPEMVASYTDFDPSKEVASKSTQVHSSVNKLMKYAKDDGDYWTRKFASVGQEKSASKSLPSVLDDMLHGHSTVDFKDEGDGNQNVEIDLSGIKHGDRLFKSASASMAYVNDQMQKLAEDARDAMMTASLNARDAVQSIYSKLIKSADPNKTWSEMAEDIDDKYGEHIKSAAICGYVEAHMESDHKLKLTPVDLEKRAGFRTLANDRHGIYEAVDELDVCADMFKEARDLYNAMTEKPAEPEVTEKEASALITAMQRSTSPEYLTNYTDDAAKIFGYVTGADRMKNQKALREAALSKAKQQAAIQQLMLSDPVIAAADPYEVEDLYNTISSLNETIASDPRLLGPVIKESLQYKSLPIQMIKDIVSVDKDRRQAEKYKEETDELKKLNNRK